MSWMLEAWSMAAVGGYRTFKGATMWKKFDESRNNSSRLVSHHQVWAVAFITPDGHDKRSTTGSKQ